MDIITLDWETFYDPAQRYSLQCKEVTTESYVTDARFEEILCSAKRNDGPTEWFSGTRPEFAEWLEHWELEKNALLAQNTRFDGLILQHHYGIVPRFYMDTLAMARPSIKPVCKRIGLKFLAEYFGLREKGDEVEHVMGMRRADFSPERMRRYAEYCCHDTDLTWEIFNRLKGRTPRDEFRIIDMFLRQYLEPQLLLEPQVFEDSIKRIGLRKDKIWEEFEIQGITKKMLSSNDKFAALLRERGVEPPLKESPAWLKKPEEERDPAKQWIYAFGKDDPAFIELREEFAEDEEMSALFDARIAAKSTIEESRAAKYLDIARKHGKFRVPVVYAGAHTYRITGDEGLNVLNLSNPKEVFDRATGAPAIDPLNGGTLYTSYLRYGVVAPPDHELVGADLSQIEARWVAVLSGQQDLIEAFEAGRDIYSEFGTELFGFPVSKKLAGSDPKVKRARDGSKEAILGSGFGMGWKKFRARARARGVNLTEEEAQRMNAHYRLKYSMVKDKWAQYDQILRRLGPGGEDSITDGIVRFFWENDTDLSIALPNGTFLHYPNFKWARKKKEGMENMIQFSYKNAGDKHARNLWGGVIMENLAQSLACINIKQIMLAVLDELGYRTVLQIYDECLFCVRKEDVAGFLAALGAIFRRRPEWCPELPLDYEAKAGHSYGDI